MSRKFNPRVILLLTLLALLTSTAAIVADILAPRHRHPPVQPAVTSRPA